MPKKALENLTESMFYVLMALYRGAKCGIEIAGYVEAQTSGETKLGPATLYTVLSKFEKEGYIEEIGVEGRKRTYRITGKGRSAYRDELDRLRRLIANAESEGAFRHER